MKQKTQVIVYLILFIVIDTVIPLPITAVLLLYVVLKRPSWFADLYRQVYV